jgi:hypothetical protein
MPVFLRYLLDKIAETLFTGAATTRGKGFIVARHGAMSFVMQCAKRVIGRGDINMPRGRTGKSPVTPKPSNELPMTTLSAQAQGPLNNLALHTLGWKAFQDLCAQICEVALQQVVSVYREAQDGGQDAVFLLRDRDGKVTTGTVQCKFTSDPYCRLKPYHLTEEKKVIRELVKKNLAHTYYFITNMGIDAPDAVSIRDDLIHLGITEPHVLGRDWITLQIRESARLRALVPR